MSRYVLLVQQARYTYAGAVYAREWFVVEFTHVFELSFEHGDHVLFDNYALLVEVFDNVVMIGAIDAHDDGLDGRIAFDENTCSG